MTDHTADFEALASDAGLPVTEAEINAEFDKLREGAGLVISNTSAFGPFWRFINAAVTSATQWLVGFIITTVLPQAFVKTATGVFLELHAWAVNLTRKLAVKAVGTIEFTRIDTAGELVVPVGVVVQSTVINGQVYSLVTTAGATFLDGNATLDVAVAALGDGAAYNLGAGYYSVLPEAVNGVASVTNTATWLTKPGTDTEKDDDLRDRIRNQYTAINQWHTDAVYTAIIASFDGVTTNNVYFNSDAPRGPGTADAYIMLEQGDPTAQQLADIQSEITDKGNHGHGDDLLLKAMPASGHNITATVWPVDNFGTANTAQLLTDVENFIRCAFRENTSYTPTKTQPWALFSVSDLGRELHAQFPNLKNVGFDLTHIDSALDIPRLNTLTVAQNA